MELRAYSAGRENVAQITGKAIADIEHRMYGKILRQPARLVQTRLEIKVFAFKRTAQFTGNKNRVADLRPGTKHAFATSNGAKQCDRNQYALWIGGRLSADDRDIMPAGQCAHA
jgi:hypothetical protein